MEVEWKKHNNGQAPPAIDEQGSDALIKTIWNACELGTIPTVDLKQVVSHLPDPRTMMTPRKKRTSRDGVVTEFEEDSNNELIKFAQTIDNDDAKAEEDIQGWCGHRV